MTPHRGRAGLADLLRALAAQTLPPSSFCLDSSADGWFGYRRVEPEVTSEPAPRRRTSTSRGASVPIPSPHHSGPLKMPAVFAVTEVKDLPRHDTNRQRLPTSVRALSRDDLRLRPAADRCLVRDADICSKARLLPALKRWLASARPGPLDLRRTVELLASQLPLDHLLRYPGKRWQPDLLVLLDFSESMWPYRHDLLRLCQWLRQEAGEHLLDLRCVEAEPFAAWRPLGTPDRNGPWRDPQPNRWPAPGGKVLVVSDLGLARGVEDGRVAQDWRRLVIKLQQAGQEVLVLTPLGRRQLPNAMGRRSRIVRWTGDAPLRAQSSGGTAEPAVSPTALQQLLAMVAASRRTDPALLRALRRRLPQGKGDASLEGQVWSHPDVVSGGACWIHPDRSADHLRRFALLPEGLQQAAHELCRDHHRHLPPVLAHEEVLLRHQWGSATLRQSLSAEARVAGDFFRAMKLRLDEPGYEQWFDVARDILGRLTAESPDDVPEALRELADAVYADDRAGPVPAWVPLERAELATEPVERWLVHDVPSGRVLLVPEKPEERQRALFGPILSRSMDFRRGSARQRVRLALNAQTGAVDFGDLRALDVAEWRTPDRSIRAEWAARPLGVVGWRCEAREIVAALPTLSSSELASAMAVSIRATRSGELEPGAASVTWTDSSLLSPVLSFRDQEKSPLRASFGVDRFGAAATIYGLTPRPGAPATEAQSREEPLMLLQRFRWIEPGTFLMGSPTDEPGREGDEGPRHLVTITHGFWLADTPCTQAFWTAVMDGANPSRFKGRADAARCPVENVSWDDVQLFLARLQALLPQGCRAGLPTEAEWEYAARAGLETAYWWGHEPDPEKSNMAQSQAHTTPVDHYRPNPWGLHDVLGNVWEWCADGPRKYGDRTEVDPSGGTEGDLRVMRGGSWLGLAGFARSAFRFRGHRGGDWYDCGFRLALRSPGPGGEGVVEPGEPDLGAGRRPASASAGRPGQMGPKQFPKRSRTVVSRQPLPPSKKKPKR